MIRRAPVAIVGMAARFPGAPNLRAFWKLLREGRDAVRPIPEDRRFDLADLLPRLTPEQKAAVGFGGFIDDIDQFDAPFFGISATEAKALDPKQRLALEVAWCALEDAAIAPDSLRGSRTGVYMGTSVYDYYERLFDAQAVDTYFGSGNFNCVIANRISYLLDLRGPSMAIETACSASLTALHQACSALHDGSCDLALAGGAMSLLSPAVTVSFALGGFLAPDGRSKAFDNSADGYVRGEGAGMLVLKRLDEAVRDGDRIWTVIEASALNQDGRSNGLTAPNPKAQEALLREAYAQARVAPARIDYVEAHGTGTRLGDPIEVNALGAVLGAERDPAKPLRIGSVKSNIGHLEAAAGIAGIIKTSLAMYHGELPPSLHFRQPNALIAFERMCVRVQDRLEAWPLGADGRRWAGVSAFSFAGANAHVVLASAPASPHGITAAPAGSPELLVLSAKSEAALDAQIRNFAAHLDESDCPDLAAVSLSLQRGRASFRHRAAFVARSLQDARVQCRDGSSVCRGEAGMRPPKVAFLFPGQGAQYAGMARSLYETWPAFRKRLDQCAAWMAVALDGNLIDLCLHADDRRLARTENTQPALFAMQWALADALRELGMMPAAVLGHSVGEYAAAVMAGIMDAEAAALAVCARGHAIAAIPDDAGMTAVRLDDATVSALVAEIGQALAISAINAPDAVTVSGGFAALAVLERRLSELGASWKRLDVSRAFHSPWVAGAQESLAQAFDGVVLQSSQLPTYSSRDGGLDRGAMSESDYWVSQMVAPVRYADAAKALMASGVDLAIEIGPSSGLPGLTRRSAPDSKAVLQVTQSRQIDGWTGMLQALARWYVAGGAPDWSILGLVGRTQPVSLPHYPFQRQRFWYDQVPTSTSLAGDAGTAPDDRIAHTDIQLAVPQRVRAGKVGLKRLPALAGHFVFGEVVIPASLSLVAALEAIADRHGHVALDDVHWPAAATLATGLPDLDLQVVQADDQVSVHVRAQDDQGSWQRLMHAGAIGRIDTMVVPVTIEWPEAQRLLEQAPNLGGDALYETLEELGLGYRAPFRAVQALVGHESTIVARISAVDGLSPALQRVVLLDAAMHPVAMFAPGTAHVPFALERLQLGRLDMDHLTVCWRRRPSLQANNDDLIVDGVAFDPQGEKVLAWQGLHLRRAQQFHLVSSPRPVHWKLPSADSLFSAEWLAMDGPETSMPVPMPFEKCDALTPPLLGYRDAMAALESRVLHWLPAVLVQFGMPAAFGTTISDSAVDALAHRLPGHRARLFRRCLARAVETGILNRSEQGLDWSADARLGIRLAEVSDVGLAESDYEARLLHRCLRALPEILADGRDAVELLFEGDGRALLAGVYGQSVGAQACNRELAKALHALQQQLPEGRALSVLEVGAGTGATTGVALEILDGARLNYMFSDVSAAFMAGARERFADHRSLRWRVFDLESDESVAGFDGERFDVIVAANVVHATKDIPASLARLHRLLRPGGYLLLLEVTEQQLWLDLVFGLTGGWWAFTDARQDSALLDAQAWDERLRASGFTEVGRRAAHWKLHQQVLIARKPELLETVCLRPAQFPSNEGATSFSVPVPVSASTYLSADGRALAQVLVVPSGVAPLDAGTAVLATLNALARDAEIAPPRIFVLTSGGQAVLPNEAVNDLAAASIQGLVRAFDLERPEFGATLIDVDTVEPLSAERLVAYLECELQAGSRERELAWRDGQRFVHRAHVWVPAAAGCDKRLLAGGASLDDIKLVDAGISAPAAGQVRIRTTWSGINFLDLLDALGALPFKRPEGLGSECVGQIEAIGDGVHGLAVGDWVMAIAPGSMASVATIDARYTHPVPRHWPLERAVSVPVAFLTALRALDLAEVAHGELVLIHAAAGATGWATLQLARARGARVVASASRHKADWVRSQGAEAVFDSRRTDFAQEVLGYTQGQGVAVVVNSLTSPGFIDASLACLQRGGRFVELAKQGISSDAEMASKRPDVRYHVLDLYRETASCPELVANGLRDIVATIDRARLPLMPVRTTSPEQATSLFRRMQRGQHIGKLAIQWRASLSTRQLATDLDGSYLITGGTGGLGLIVADWLASRGAKHLVLVSRRGPVDARATAMVESLRERGVMVELPVLDLNDDTALTTLCARFGQDWPPVLGVFHAAGVLSDGLLPQQDGHTLAPVLTTKLTAACQLANLLAAQPLQYFVLFSSVAGVFGSPGQANHSAANAGLDGLAAQLRARGVPALSIALGTVSEVGSAASLGADRRATGKGILPLQPAEALAAVELAIGSGLAWLAAVPMNWSEADPCLRQRAMFSNLVTKCTPAAIDPGKVGTAASTPTPAMPDWQRMSDSERLPALVRLAQQELARVLGFAATDLDFHQGFTDLGIDSLGAVEMRNRLQQALGISLPSSLLFDYPNVHALSQYLARRLAPVGAAGANPVAEAEAAPVGTVAATGCATAIDGSDVRKHLSDKLAQLRRGAIV